jgi:hypothetical protein
MRGEHAMEKGEAMRKAPAARNMGAATLAAALCFGAAFASSASGEDVTIGPSDLSGTTASARCSGGGACTDTFAQLTAGILLEAPADGVITSWRVHGDTGPTGAIALRVLRDEDGGGGQLTAVGTSPAVLAAVNDATPAHLVNMPVLKGDSIGVNVLSPGEVFYTVPAGAEFGKWGEGLKEGAKQGPDNTLAGRLMVNAVESLKPTVSGVSPASGTTAGGETVTITGSSLDGATGVKFGGVAAPSFTAAAQGIISEFMSATVPAGVAGAVHVQVIGPGGASYETSADLYSYVAPVFPQPSILIASPLSGAIYKQGQAVTADYSCAPPAGATVSVCAGPVAKGAAIDTASPGSHAFTVSAKATNGASASRSVLYTVTASSPLGAGLGSMLGPGLAGEGPVPVIGNVGETVRRWRERSGPSRVGARRKPPVGTTFSFTLNEPASVALRFTRLAGARSVHGSCVAPSRSNRNRPRCVRRIAAGAIVYAGHAGINRIRFLGRTTPAKQLRAGGYTLSLTATDARGRRSAPRSLTFTIVG